VSKVGHLLSFVDLYLAAMLIAAAKAYTFLIAEFSLRKALTVHFETIYLSAFATLRGLLPWR
jgi:hypothetical protein